MSFEVGQIDLGLDVNKAYFNRQLKGISSGAEKSVTSAFSGLGKKIGMVLGVAAIAQFTKSCLDLGSDLSEVQNVVDTTFTSMSSKVNAFASSAIDNFGLSETVAKKYMGTLGTMSKSMGFAEDAAYSMAEGVTGLAGDVASFYNLTSDESYNKLKSIWTGETESIKELGVVMTQTALDQYALNNGFGKTTANMTEQEKVLLRYKYVMSSLAGAQGDFVRTSDGWANQTRVLSLRFEQLKATLGQGFINALTPVIKLLNSIVARLQVAAEAFVDFTKVIFNIKDAITGGSSDNVFDNVTGSAEDANNAIKSVNKQLSGFDKLNNLSESKSGDSGSLGVTLPSLDDVPSISDSVIKNTPIIKWLDTVEEKLEPTKNALSNLWTDGLKPLMDFQIDTFKSFYNDFLKPVSNWVLSEGIPKLCDVVIAFSSEIDWNKLSEGFSDLFNVLTPFTIGFGEGLLTFMESLAGLVGKGIDILITGISNALGWLVDNVPPETLKSVGEAVGVLAGSIVAFKIGAALPGLLTGLGKSIKGIMEVLSSGDLAPGFGALSGFVAALLALDAYSDATFMEDYKEGIASAVGSISEAINNYDTDMSKIDSDYISISKLAQKYYDLSKVDYDSLTEGEKTLLKEYYEAVKKYCPKIVPFVDDVTKAYRGTKEELQQLIKDMQRQYKLAAASEFLLKLEIEGLTNEDAIWANEKEFQKVKKQLETMARSQGFSDMADSIHNLTSDMALNADTMKSIFGSTQQIEEHLGNDAYIAYRQLETFAEGIDALRSSQELLDGRIANARTLLSELGTEYTTASIDVLKYGSDVVITGAKIGTSFGKVKTSSNDTKVSVGKSLGGMSKVLDDFYNSTSKTTSKVSSSAKTMASDIEKSTTKSVKNIQSVLDKMGSFTSLPTIGANIALAGVTGINTSSFINTAGIPKLAEGGYVPANTPRLAMIGDNKTKGEIVAPEDKLRSITGEAVNNSKLTLLLAEQNALLKEQNRLLLAIENKENTISSKSVYEAVRHENKIYTKRTGHSGI